MINNLPNLGHRLELLCAEILIANKYLDVTVNKGHEQIGDISATDPLTKERLTVEVKFYRSLKVNRAILRNAAIQIIHWKQATGRKGMFITTAMFDDRDFKLLKHIGIDE